MLRRLVVCLVLGFSLSGCITADNTLSIEQIASFRLQAVDVSVAPNAQILWDDPERAAAGQGSAQVALAHAAAGAPADWPATARRTVSDLLRKSMIDLVGPELNGTRPVRLVVRIHALEIVSPIQRIILGGSHHMTADVDLLDAKSGAVLLTLPAYTVLVGGGGGLVGVALDNMIRDEPIRLVTASYAGEYRNWLLRK
jgi:hypothetical protein